MMELFEQIMRVSEEEEKKFANRDTIYL